MKPRALLVPIGPHRKAIEHASGASVRRLDERLVRVVRDERYIDMEIEPDGKTYVSTVLAMAERMPDAEWRAVKKSGASGKPDLAARASSDRPPVAFRLSRNVIAALKGMAATYGESQAAILEVAIPELARAAKERGRLRP